MSFPKAVFSTHSSTRLFYFQAILVGVLIGVCTLSASALWSIDPATVAKPPKGSGSGGSSFQSSSGSSGGGQAFLGTQVVFLDFDSGMDGIIDYTPTMRDDTEALMDGHYSLFDFSFTQTAPGVGDFSTITFNAGSAGGLAEHIDFRNLDPNDTAVVNVDGLGIVGTADIVSASAVIGSHELGHLQGLRHGDSYGPIGSGISSTGAPGVLAYFPPYPGPEGADETTDHVMASPAAVGSSLADLTTPSWFSERSAVKLAFNESPNVAAEIGGSTVLTPEALGLAPLAVPNTIVSGDNAGLAFDVEAAVVTGSISIAGESDFYSFSGLAGELFNFEVISIAINDRLIPIDPNITIFHSDGVTHVPYYADVADNDDEFETFDSILIDLFLPADDTYLIEVRTSDFDPTGTGDYELFGYKFAEAAEVIPEPSTLILSLVGLAVFAVVGYWRQRQAAKAA
jgi:hypothetical protein